MLGNAISLNHLISNFLVLLFRIFGLQASSLRFQFRDFMLAHENEEKIEKRIERNWRPGKFSSSGHIHCCGVTDALWFRTAMNGDVSTWPLAHAFACSLAPLHHLLTPHYFYCVLHSAHSLARLLTHSLPS